MITHMVTSLFTKKVFLANMLWALARENLFLVFANNMVQTSLRIRYKHILIFLASLCS